MRSPGGLNLRSPLVMSLDTFFLILLVILALHEVFKKEPWDDD